MSNNPAFSIIIVSYNVWEYLEKCLCSLYKQKNIDFEIIVVDNNSNDNTPQYITQQFPKINLIANKFNAGFSTANNQGILISKGDYIFLLNPDTEIQDENTLFKLEDRIKSSSDINAFCPCLLNDDGSVQLSCWSFPNLQDIFFEIFYLQRFVFTRKIYAPQENKLVDAASGAALIFRHSLVNKIGVLDETLFWMEDTDYCYRINKAGEKLMYLPDIKIVHYVGKSANKNYKITIPNQVLSKLKFFKKHKSWVSFALANIFTFLLIIIKCFTFIILSPFGKLFRRKMDAYFFTFKKYFDYNFKDENIIIT